MRGRSAAPRGTRRRVAAKQSAVSESNQPAAVQNAMRNRGEILDGRVERRSDCKARCDRPIRNGDRETVIDGYAVGGAIGRNVLRRSLLATRAGAGGALVLCFRRRARSGRLRLVTTRLGRGRFVLLLTATTFFAASRATAQCRIGHGHRRRQERQECGTCNALRSAVGVANPGHVLNSNELMKF
jgi:hypothetical protein